MDLAEYRLHWEMAKELFGPTSDAANEEKGSMRGSLRQIVLSSFKMRQSIRSGMYPSSSLQKGLDSETTSEMVAAPIRRRLF